MQNDESSCIFIEKDLFAAYRCAEWEVLSE